MDSGSTLFLRYHENCFSYLLGSCFLSNAAYAATRPPATRSSEGSADSSAGTSSPPSRAPLTTANRFDLRLRAYKPRSTTACLIVLSFAFFASKTPVRYAALMFDAAQLYPEFLSSRE